MNDDMRFLLEFLVRDLEDIEKRRGPVEERDPLDLTETRLYGEASGVRSAIAYMTGLLGISTPPGGVLDWLPTLKEAIK